MKPTRFKGWNVTYAEDQPEYQQLPAFREYKDETGNVVSCWKLTFWERIKVLFRGRLYLSVWTFRGPLQPLLPTVENPLPKEDQENGRPLDWQRPEPILKPS